MFCRNCGKEIPSGAKFCTACGSRVLGAEAIAASRKKEKKKHSRRYLLSLGLVVAASAPAIIYFTLNPEKTKEATIAGGVIAIVGFLIVAIGILMMIVAAIRRSGLRAGAIFISLGLVALLVAAVIVPKNFGQTPPQPTDKMITGVINVGTKVEVVQNSIGTSGGTITIDKPGDLLDGFQVEVPANSYKDARTFQVSYAPIKNHIFGKYFNPVSPLISIETGGGYSDEVILVKIPVKIPEGHFAMAFFYDGKSGQLEGLPLVAEDRNFITIATKHFSDIIASSIVEEYLRMGVAESGFIPGLNDWQFPNKGSYIAPKGHCAGQSLSAMWYYYERYIKDNSPPLNGLYDNNGNERTSDLWQDDTLAYRLASMVQVDTEATWDSLSANYMWEWAERINDRQQMDAFAYSILATGQPQFVYIADTVKGGAHAMVVYRVSDGNLAIADPNYPGALDRKIKLVNDRFEPYNSGENRDAIERGEGKKYNRIWYMAKTALVDWSQMASRWSELEQKTIGDKKFPTHTLQALTQMGWLELKDGFNTGDRMLGVRALIGSLLRDVEIYRYDTQLRKIEKLRELDTEDEIELKNGPNRLGIAVYGKAQWTTKDERGNEGVARGWRWVDFKWVTVTYNPTAASPTTAPKPVNEASVTIDSVKTNFVQLEYDKDALGKSFVDNYLFDIEASGNVSGPVGTQVLARLEYVSRNGVPWQTMTFTSSWRRVDGNFIRSEGDPALTNWAVIYKGVNIGFPAYAFNEDHVLRLSVRLVNPNTAQTLAEATKEITIQRP